MFLWSDNTEKQQEGSKISFVWAYLVSYELFEIFIRYEFLHLISNYLFLFCQSFKNRMKLLETTKFITWYVHTSCCKFVNYWNVVKLKFRPIFTFYKYIVHTMYLNFKCFMGFPILKVTQINYFSRNQFHNMYIKWLSNFGLSWPG